jgi:hypothetical protein
MPARNPGQKWLDRGSGRDLNLSKAVKKAEKKKE